MTESGSSTNLESLILKWHEDARAFQLSLPDSTRPLTSAYQWGMAQTMVRAATLRLIEAADARGLNSTGLRRLARLLQSTLDERALVLGQPDRQDWLLAALEVDQLAAQSSQQHASGQTREDGPISVSDEGVYSPAALAKVFDLPADPLRTRLNRWRQTSDTGWIENPDRKPRESKYLYRLSAVRFIIEAMKNKPNATSQPTSERPAKKR